MVTGHLEEMLARQKGLEQDMKRLLQLEKFRKQKEVQEGPVNNGSKCDQEHVLVRDLLDIRFIVLVLTLALAQSLFIASLIN